MHNPKYLLELKTRAEKALNSRPPDGLAGFFLTWFFWEAIRHRILILACKREGWTVAQAAGFLAPERIDSQRFLRLYERITSGRTWEGSLPLPAAKIWPALEKAETLRRRTLDGTARLGDAGLQAAAWKILRFVDLLHDHPLGDPLKELPKRSEKKRSGKSLKEILKEGGE